MLRGSLRPRRCAGLLAASAVLLAGCSSEEALDVDGFAPGACTELSGALSDVDEALRAVADEDLSPAEAGDRFEAVQAALKDAEGAPASAAELRTQLGFFRIAVDSNSFDEADAEKARAALDAVVEDCRA